MALDQILSERLKKLDNIKKSGIDPFPSTTPDKISIKEALEKMGDKVSVAGRIKSLRSHGKITFADLEDETGKIQLLFSQNNLKGEKYDFLSNLDIGDFLHVSGEVGKTQSGQITITSDDYILLTKSLRPLPSEFYGLKDTEERLRKRYLDLLMNPEVRELFKKKSFFWQEIRSYMLENKFLEVETPVLQDIPGGADARPFITHHYALDIDLYLRISLELPLKRLLVGGFEKVFEIGRIFRNEGIDDEHLQDYTQLEFYWAYADYNQLMDFVQKMYQEVIQKVFGTLKLTWQGQEIDWSGNWTRIEYTKLLNDHWGVDIDKISVEELYKLAADHKVSVEPNLGKGRLLDYIYKKTIRPKLIQPTFILNHPVEVEPLAKRLPKDLTKVQRMQVLAMGSELGKGFSELNDPIDQKQRFEEQMKLREQGDEEAQMMDEDYVETMEYGMPPNAGFGISERLFSMLVDKPVRETVIFPTMKPALKIKAADKIKVKDSSKTKLESNPSSYISREQAYNLVVEMLPNKNLVKHCLAVEAIMRALSKELREKNKMDSRFLGNDSLLNEEFDEEEWGLVGLLHDADYEATNKDLETHTDVIVEKVKELGGNERLINGILGHHEMKKPDRENFLEKAIYAADELSGLVTAVTLVRPEKKLSTVTVENVVKKFHEKSFAAGAHRHQILTCEKDLGIPLEEFITISLKAMQGISDDLGL